MFIFIWSFYVVNFNVSSTKITHILNILETFSMGVTKHLDKKYTSHLHNLHLLIL